MILEFIIGEESGERLDVILTELIEGASRSYIQKLFDEGKITLNGNSCVKKTKANPGDVVKVDFPEERDDRPCPKDIPLNIVYEDQDLIVVDKPRDLVVHPAQGHYDDTLVNGILFHLGGEMDKELTEACHISRPGIVHRIDKDTSGLLVVSKSLRAFSKLSQDFRTHSITRCYNAVTYNGFGQDDGTVDAAIGRDPGNRLRRKVNGIEPRPAITHYHVIERMGNFTHIEARLETGRTHQIRVHMAYIGNPVVGDLLYGPKKDRLGAKGQVLHAGKLGFNHPVTGEYMEFNSPLPEYFNKILDKARQLNK